MLTFPSDSLSQVVCPMDEDAIPPIPVCSAPPFSEPPSPLLPLSSVTPSCAHDGPSGHRRSGRIQDIRARTPKRLDCADIQAAQRQSGPNPSSTKRQREAANMVQTSQSKLQRGGRTHLHEEPNKVGFSIRFTAEHQNEWKISKSTESENIVSPLEKPLVEQTMRNPDDTKSEMDGCEELLEKDACEELLEKDACEELLEKDACEELPEKDACEELPEKDACEELPEKDACEELPEKDACEELPEMDACEELPEKDACEELPEKDACEELPEMDACEELPEKDACEELPEKDACEELPEKDACEELPEKDACEELPEMDACEDFAGGDLGEDASVSKGWVIGPFFQSLKSKMASFSEIVMTPVKLFRATSPLTAHDVFEVNDATDIHASEKDDEHQTEARNLVDSAEINSEISTAPKKSKKLHFNESVCRTACGFECAISGGNENLPDVVPLVCVASKEAGEPSGSSFLLHKSASHESDLNVYTAVKGQKGKLSSVKPLSRRDAGNGCESVEVNDRNQLQLVGLATNKSPLKPSFDAEQMECQQISEVYSVSKFARAKRGLKPNCVSQDDVKRKKMNMALGGDVTKGARTQRKRGADESMKPDNKRQVTSTRANAKAKSEHDRKGCLEKSSSELQNNSKCKKAKRSNSCKRMISSDDNLMDVETTVPHPTAGQPVKKRLSVVLVRPDEKEISHAAKCGNANKKQLKRKPPNHTSLEVESSSVSALSHDGLEPMSTGFKSEDAPTGGANQPSKRLRNSLRSAVKFSVLAEGQEKTKESRSKNGRAKISVDKVIFPQLPLVHSRFLNEEDTAVTENEQGSSATMTGETFLKASEISNCNRTPSIRLVNTRRRRKDPQRRRCRGLQSRMCKTEEGSRSVTVEDADLAATRMRSSETNVSMRLSRSYSCPDVLILHHDNSPWVSPPHSPHYQTHAMHHHHGNLTSHAQRSLRRARRHTVCSVEVEREIAPLCLRKEVYPSRRSASYDPMTHNLSPAHVHSPCSSLTALASCFLSSPLAFLSKKSECRATSANAGTCSRVPSPPPSSSCSTAWHSPGFALGSSSAASLDPSENPAPYEAARRQQSEEEDDGEDTSSSSQEFEDAGLREEKALSDSEIRVVKKHEEQKKVSSIRIRKTLPKPQTNLTPMGLPKPVRVKKKDFSLEEIYTNKNFSKPPESRLETIFEVPLNRKNGSESWFGPRRVKRFLEFLEVGEARKPKKPLVGVGKTGPSSSRPRRGGFPKDEPSLGVQDVDSLLCSKLDELNLWLIHDQSDERETDNAVPVSAIMT